MEKLRQCDDRLQRLCNRVIRSTDFTVLCGHRRKEAQDIAFVTGASRVKWPNSKHNKRPSQAVDIAPWKRAKAHIDWNDREAFFFLAGAMKQAACELGIKIRWGGDWDDDPDTANTFDDLGHFELVDAGAEGDAARLHAAEQEPEADYSET
jgi:peptidoglycan L-alanyl-D-glutamate endopeptidase CwlK